MKRGIVGTIVLVASAIGLILTTIAVTNQQKFTTASNAQGTFVVGGIVQASDTGAGIGGVSLTVGARVTATAVTTEHPVTTDGNGYFAVAVALGPGDSYHVRPGPAPAGFKDPAGTSNDSNSRAAHLGGNTPVRSPSYEQQVVNEAGCAQTPGWANGACNFVYDPAPAAPPPAQNPPPVQNPPPNNDPLPPPPAPAPGTSGPSTGSGGLGFQSFQVFINDCANGFSGAASYTPEPFYYHNMEIVTGVGQAGIGKGRLVGQSRNPNGGTFTDPHAAWEAANGPILFYVYTVMENANPPVDYTIHGTNGGAGVVSAGPGQPPPQPFTLNCSNQAPPPNPGEQPNPGIPDGDPSCGAQGQACCAADACDNPDLECAVQ